MTQKDELKRLEEENAGLREKLGRYEAEDAPTLEDLTAVIDQQRAAIYAARAQRDAYRTELFGALDRIAAGAGSEAASEAAG